MALALFAHVLCFALSNHFSSLAVSCHRLISKVTERGATYTKCLAFVKILFEIAYFRRSYSPRAGTRNRDGLEPISHESSKALVVMGRFGLLGPCRL